MPGTDDARPGRGLASDGLAGLCGIPGETGAGYCNPFSSGSMDAVFMAFTLELFDTPEIPVVIAECRRVLRQGGRIGLVAMARPDRSGWMMRLYEWAHHTFPVWVDCRPIRSQIFLEEAGFILLDRKARSMWGLPVEILLSKKSLVNVKIQ